MKYNVIPFDSIGLVKLGMRSEEIRSILGEKGLMRSENDFGEIEIWIEQGMRITYEDKICSNIECLSPAEPYLFGENLFALSCVQVFELLKSNEDKVYSDGEILLFLKSGLALYFGDISPGIQPSLLAIFPKNSREEYLYLYDEIDHIL
jgi:hypothetical protein